MRDAAYRPESRTAGFRLCIDRNLTCFLLRLLRNGHAYFQNAVLKLGFGLVGLGALRQRDHAVEPAVGSFRPVISALMALLFAALLSLYGDALFSAFHLHVIFV